MSTITISGMLIRLWCLIRGNSSAFKSNPPKERIRVIIEQPDATRIEYLTAGIAGIQFQGFRLEAALITLEAPEVWIIRKIMTTQIPVNQTELHLLKNVVNWGFVSQAILKKEESKFKKEKKLALVIKNKQLEKNHDYLLDDNLEDSRLVTKLYYGK
ncbi:hypothetical protein RhiirA1_471683 [Rhizophagus irregularis]|uniref:Uncharacterized protein n=1 Tax=Rhizophagus irregularis TaxID=588596 RepID=A0A2N0R3Y1_9GLOM|nr:hypothetical protein RhiirA1_471683 [Rhizophagus irregularis]